MCGLKEWRKTVSNTEISEYWDYHPVQRGLDILQPILGFIGGRGFIGGSFAAWMATEAAEPIKPNDVDVYAISDQVALELAKDLAKYLAQDWETNPITYTFLQGERFPLPIQVIKPNPEWNDFPMDILNSFDLSLSRAIFKPSNPRFVLADEGIHYPSSAKVLRLRNPLRSLKRVMKYNARGAQFTDWELLKLFSAWERMPEERRREMRDEAYAEAFPTPEYEPEGPGYMYDDDDYYEGE